MFPIAVPPLRDRGEDIPDLVRHFLTRIAAEEGKRVRAISGEAVALLCRHRWPGNVRQLENTVFRAVVLAEGDSIGMDEFPQIAAQIAAQSAMPSTLSPPSSPDLPAAPALPGMIELPPLLDIGTAPASAVGGPGILSLLDAHDEVRPLEDIETDAIRFAIAHYRGQMSEVARRLHIGRSTLYRKLDHLGLAERSDLEHTEPADTN